MSLIAERLAIVQDRIARVASANGRSPDEVTLIAVTKTWPEATVLEAYAAGLHHIGENRVAEYTAKRAAIEANHPDVALTWHFIGALQSRQALPVADTADTFHALDRVKIARRLSNRIASAGRVSGPLPVFLEVNVSGEASKAGFHCAQWENDAGEREQLLADVAAIRALPGLQVTGLMTMAPWGAPEPAIRDVFRRTRRLAQWLKTAVPTADWSHLSMGMTDDFELAIAEGATHIRVGRALFGNRPG